MKKILYISLFGFMCLSTKLIMNWSEKGRYVLDQGRVFDTSKGSYIAQTTSEERIRIYREHQTNMHLLFIAIGVVGVVGVICGVGYWNRKEKEKDLIARITAEYETWQSFKENYPEWSKLSYKAKHLVRSFYDRQGSN